MSCFNWGNGGKLLKKTKGLSRKTAPLKINLNK